MDIWCIVKTGSVHTYRVPFLYFTYLAVFEYAHIIAIYDYQSSIHCNQIPVNVIICMNSNWVNMLEKQEEYPKRRDRWYCSLLYRLYATNSRR